MNDLELIYEGKAKKVYKANDDNIILYYKDDYEAYNGVRKVKIEHKGELNNKISAIILKYLAQNEVPNHFIKLVDNSASMCKKLNMFPLEIVIRNYTAGSLVRRMGLQEGIKLITPIVELCYKNDRLGDPLINDSYVYALNLASKTELSTMYSLALDINDQLTSLFREIGIILVDLKLEFGKDDQGNIFLADEISPDTARLWDLNTHEKLGKDRFRSDLGKGLEAGFNVYERLEKAFKLRD